MGTGICFNAWVKSAQKTGAVFNLIHDPVGEVRPIGKRHTWLEHKYARCWRVVRWSSGWTPGWNCVGEGLLLSRSEVLNMCSCPLITLLT